MDPTRPSSSQTGQTLIEVLVTALIVLFIAAATATALISSADASGDQRLRATADTLAGQDQERMRGLSDEQLAGLGGAGQSYSRMADGVSFTITSTTAAVSAAGQSSCTGGGASDFHISSTVSWSEQGSGSAANSVSADSLIARPTTGDLIAVVTDQAGQPVPGVSVVTQSGPSNQSGVTDANGCLLFAGLTPGAYNIGFSRTGYVDTLGNPTPTKSVSVTATGTPTQYTQSFAQAGAIAATLTGARTASSTRGDADKLSWSSVGNANPTASASTTTASSLTTPALYPFDTAAQGATPSYTQNYTVWAGGCPQQEPPAASRVTATVLPGSAPNVTIAEPALNITSIVAGGLPVTPTSLTLSFASQSGTSCADTWTPPVANATAPGVPPSTGWLQDPGQPYADGTTGALTVCVVYQKLTGASRYGTATITNASFATPIPATLTLTSATGC